MRHLAVLLAALPAAAAAEGAESRDALLATLATNGCAVSEAETATLFGSEGFDPEYVRRELGQMVLDGTAFLEGGSILRVRVPHCPPAEPAPTPAQALRSEIEGRGCVIDEEAALGLGADAQGLRPVIQSWLDSGAARIEGGTLRLEDCT